MYVCVLGLQILSLYTIFLLDFGTVPTDVFVFFILLYFFPHFIEYVLIVIYKQGGCGHCHMVVSYLLRLPI